MVAGMWREAVHALVGQEAEREASRWVRLHLPSSPLGAPIRASQPKSHRLLNQCHHEGNISPRHSLDSNHDGVDDFTEKTTEQSIPKEKVKVEQSQDGTLNKQRLSTEGIL